MDFAYTWDFSFIGAYLPILFNGVGITVQLSLLTIFFTFIIGTVAGIMAANPNQQIKWLYILLIDVIRSIPLIVLILWFYYLLPAIGFKNPHSFWPALIALVINNSAFYADIIRGSIEGLPKGSIMAAKALGMDALTILYRIIMPEVYRETFPSTTLTAIAIIRFTSLASIVGVYELTHSADYVIALTYKPLEVYTVITLLYLVIILPLTLLSRKTEKSGYFLRRTI